MMENKLIMLVGNPDSGKSNFVGRLWLAIQSNKYGIVRSEIPKDIKYVEEIAEHILQGRFVPRTDKEEKDRHFEVTVIETKTNTSADILMPDVSGELWEDVTRNLEMPENWAEKLNSSDGAILFIRVHSEQNIQPLDWVTSRALLGMGFDEASAPGSLPTQVKMIELLRILEGNLKVNAGRKPKVAIIVTAWDLLNPSDSSSGPKGYLKDQFPMFAGRIADSNSVDIKIFGSSIVGGDFSIDEFMQSYLAGENDDDGYVIITNDDDTFVETSDITAPIQWLLE